MLSPSLLLNHLKLTTHNTNRRCRVSFYIYTFVGQPLSKQLYVYFLFHLGEGSGNLVHINKLIPFLTKLARSSLKNNFFLITGLD